MKSTEGIVNELEKENVKITYNTEIKGTKMMKYFDPWIYIVIVITVLLFTIALFVKGFTHNLLLEAGVLLVSIKLIMMAYRNSINYSDLKKELNEIRRLLEEKNQIKIK